MESQTAYKMLFTDYPDVVNVEQMCEMLGGICDKTDSTAAVIESRSSTFWNTWN